jgi:hypothetical protein
LAGFFIGIILVMFLRRRGFWSTGQESQLCPPGSSQHRAGGGESTNCGDFCIILNTTT